MRAILILTLILFTGCGVFENEQTVPGKFVGEWEWYLTGGGWGPNVSADSVDYTIRLMIYSQNEAKWFRNDSLVDKFFIQKGEDAWTKGEWVMYSTTQKETCGFVLKHDSGSSELRLPSANCTDTPTFYFRKPGA